MINNILFLIIFIFTIYLIVTIKKKHRNKYSHAWRRSSANKINKKLKSFNKSGQIFSYLRKVDPFVVEEVILNSIEYREDIKVIRNKRYTGDNGVDGRFILTSNRKEYLYLIQVKRYSKYINAKDIIKFHEQIKLENAACGLFIHTGKSGKEVYNKLSNLKNIKLISGQKLIKLLQEGHF
ncbi:MAG: restriction endonuclease [Arcobacteraceae bacterium]